MACPRTLDPLIEHGATLAGGSCSFVDQHVLYTCSNLRLHVSGCLAGWRCIDSARPGLHTRVGGAAVVVRQLPGCGAHAAVGERGGRRSVRSALRAAR